MIRIRHPFYSLNIQDWLKWRLTYDGGSVFINTYLKKYSSREDDDSFKLRKDIAYCPAFAKAAINEVKDAIVHRMPDIVRMSDDPLYAQVMDGEYGGVDLRGSSMNNFINDEVLPDLLVMSQVGVFIDSPEESGLTLADAKNKHPYLYTYCVEDILSWSLDDNGNFTSILLQDYSYQYEFGLPSGQQETYRKLTKLTDGVLVEIFSDKDEVIQEKHLNLPEIPFKMAEISDSLLRDIANYQIALLNLESSDIGYLLKSNFPFYVEQFDPKSEAAAKMNGDQNSTATEAKVGPTSGRRYPLGAAQPAFINPSSEPIKASMEKQAQIKEDIRRLMHLKLETVQSKSVDSKKMDDRGLESGLANIGLTLQQLERDIGRIWGYYRNNKSEVAAIYPQNYSLKTQADRDEEAQKHLESIDEVPSLEYKKEICKKVVALKLGPSITQTRLQEIYAEIDKKTAISSAENLINDIEAGIIDLQTASQIRCYPDTSVEKAKKEHADRLARIAESQMAVNAANPAARGMSDNSADPNAGKQEKKNSQNADNNKNAGVKKTRGDGK